MIPADELKKDILRRYDHNPRDWRVLVGRDRRGYYDIIIIHDSDTWLIKEQPINPLQSIGFGVKDNVLDTNLAKSISTHTFGFRPLSERDVAKVTKAIRTGQSMTGVISRMLKSDPVSTGELDSPLALHGPIIHIPATLDAISENQAELDHKLRIELEKLLRWRYPQSIAPYL